MNTNKDKKAAGPSSKKEGKGSRLTVLGTISKNNRTSSSSNEASCSASPSQGSDKGNPQKTGPKEADPSVILTTNTDLFTKAPEASSQHNQESHNLIQTATTERLEQYSQAQKSQEQDGDWEDDKISVASIPTTRGDKGSMLTKLTKADKNTLKALIKISTVTAGDETVAQLYETVMSEQAKLKNIIIDQAQQIAFQKGRIEELEKRKTEPQNTPKEATGHTGQTQSLNGDQRPTYALVVSSGSLEKNEVANLLRTKLDPLELDIPDANIRPGKEGIVVTTSSKDDTNKLLLRIQNDRSLKQLNAKPPRENKIHVKVVGAGRRPGPRKPSG
ncbi:hypothetical protein MTO96_045488 [Rhipicephalus appendiculatus]